MSKLWRIRCVHRLLPEETRQEWLQKSDAVAVATDEKFLERSDTVAVVTDEQFVKRAEASLKQALAQ